MKSSGFGSKMICEITIFFRLKTRNFYMEHIIMSKKEREQLIVFEKIKKEGILHLTMNVLQ